MGMSNEDGDTRIIESCIIAGRDVPADRLICRECNALDLHLDINVDDPVEWVATCTKDHSWKFSVIDVPKDDG